MLPSVGGTSFSEFTGLAEIEAADVGIKLTPMTPFRRPITSSALVLGCPVREHARTTLTTTWFPPGGLPDRLYELDHQNEGWSVRLRPDQMKLLLDSLATLPGVAEGRIAVTDTVSLMVRRVVGGTERVFECTVDVDTFSGLARILSNVVKDDRPVPGARSSPESVARINVKAWTMRIDPRTPGTW